MAVLPTESGISMTAAGVLGKTTAGSGKSKRLSTSELVSLTNLPVVTITNAAVAMAANTRYVGSIAAFTANRNYTLPAGTTGDVIEVHVSTGDDAFELVLLGATGVSINGGTAATEWSRLFITGEFVRFRCTSTNNWMVEIDGRIRSLCILECNSAITLTNVTWNTSIAYGSVVSNIGSLHTTGKFTIRRAGVYKTSVSGSLSSNSVSFDTLPNAAFYFQMLLLKNGTVFTGTGISTNRIFASAGTAGSNYPTLNVTSIVSLAKSDVVELNAYQESGGTRYIIAAPMHLMAIEEML